MTPMVAEALTIDFSKITEAITSNAQAALPAGIAVMAAILGITIIPRVIRSFL
nr:MAG TPA: hypothetical protein [Inoviridae sp.]